MSTSDFLKLPPLRLTLEGQEMLLVPTVRPGGYCCFKGPPINIWVDTPHGKIRVVGRVVLTPPNHKHWDVR